MAKPSMYPAIMAEKARLGLTEEELAQRLGVNRTTVYHWLRNGRIPSDQLVQMADLFQCSVDYLLGRTPVRS